MAKMKSIENRFAVAVVFLLSLVMCWFLWEEDPLLIHSHLKDVRFTIYDILPQLVAGLAVMILLVRSSFRFCKLDFIVLVAVWIIAARYTLNDKIEYRIQIILLFFLFYATFRLLTSVGRRATRIMQVMFMISIIVESISGFLPLYNWITFGGSPFSATGSFLTTEAYSCFLAVGFPLALGWIGKFWDFKALRRMPTTWGKAVLQGEIIVALLCLLLIAIRLPMVSSAYGLLAVGIGSVVVALEYGLLRKAKAWIECGRKRAIVHILVASVLLISVSAGIYQLNKETVDSRFFKWKNTILAISDVPLYGVALGYFEGIHGDKEIVYFASETGTIEEKYIAGVPKDGYEWYLQVGMEVGIIGLSLFFLLIGWALWQTVLFREWERFGVAGALTSFLVFTFFASPFETLPLCVLFILLLACTCSGWRPRLTPHWWGDIPGMQYLLPFLTFQLIV